MAMSIRSADPAPDKTAQLCAMESILHSSLTEEPSAVPLSNQARLYHCPSHAFFSIFSFNRCAAFLHSSANAESLCKMAVSEKRISISYRKNPIHTLSPLPPIPTLSKPSFQSPLPIKGN